MKSSSPYIISGPCSAESPEQLDLLAATMVELGVDVFRAGAWKPRTRPNTFEGYGENALIWLKEIKQKYNIPIAIEVATAEHVQLAMKYDIDVLWLGTRTTTSPITVELIAKELENTEKTIIIKNPICTDLDLWIGAVERFQNHNVNNLKVIHRGFKVYEPQKYRSEPFWNIALEFKHIFPNIPMILDPSHIAGKRDLVKNVIEDAASYKYDGYMIEVHQSPDQALSDSAQQVTPDQFEDILAQIRPNIPSKILS